MNCISRQILAIRLSALAFSLLILVSAFAGGAVRAQAQTYPVAFPSPTTFATFDCPPQSYCPANYGVASGDFNGDGKLDVVTVDSSSDLNVVLGNGDGTFQAPISLNLAASNMFYEAIAVGDFNGDHLLDVAVWMLDATTGSTQVEIYLGNGTGSLTYRGTYVAPNSNDFNPGSNSIVASDVNGDGKLDLVAATPNNGLFVFLGNGDGTFQTPVNYSYARTSGCCTGIAVGDLNGDGKPDLALPVNDGISILLNNGNGTFGAATYYPSGVAGSSPGAGIAIGDVNGDKKPDVVESNENFGAIVFLNQGKGTFAVKGAIGSEPVSATSSVVLADINNDKKLDILINDQFGEVHTYYGKGNGTFTAGPAYPLNALGNNAEGLIVADFNNDGTVDLLNAVGYDFATVSLGRGDGSFRTAQMFNYGQTSSGHNIVTADFNGDGIPDLAFSWANNTAGSAPQSFGVMLGTSHGAPGTTTYINAGSCPANKTEWIATGDVNGDGKADIVATLQGNGGPGCQNDTVAVLTGLGTGKFKKAAYYSTGSTAQENGVFLADVNGDGKLDIITENIDGTISVLLNKGNGTYNAGKLIASIAGINQHENALAFGDFTGDGKTDIAVTTYGQLAYVYVLPGNGDGTFGAPVQTATPYYTYTLAAADINQDGKMDLLVTLQDGGCATYNKGGYAFLKGNGNGKFTAGPENCTGGSSPTYPVVADLNGDGKLDAFFGFNQENPTYLANGPVVLQGKGDGTFSRANGIFYVGGITAGNAAVADFNGDGMPDVAVVNNYNLGQGNNSYVNYVSIMLNSTQPVSISPLDVSYGSVKVGTKKPETVILTNDQSISLAVDSVTLGGADAGDFSAKSTCGTSRKAGWDCAITVTFTPSTTGTRSATLSIKDAIGTQTVSLTGTGK
jgi:hypothetical protein